MSGQLLPPHFQDLQRSGLSNETIRSLGFFSGTTQEVEEILCFNAGSGLVLPYPCLDKEERFCRVKPDNPPIIDGKPAKYLSPKGAKVRGFIPPKTNQALKNPTSPVIITEGEKKSAKADQEDFPCIGLAGVWSFYQDHALIPDLMQLGWSRRPVIIAYDSDAAEKDQVKEAIFVLERELVALGANAKVIRFKSAPDGSKTGLDDFLVAESPMALRELLEKAKSYLDWEIDDIARLLVEDRLQAFRHLFRKLAWLDPVELEPYRNLCVSQLTLPRRDFQAQLNSAKEDLHRQRNARRPTIDETDHAADKVEPAVIQGTLELLKDPVLLYQIGETIQRRGIAGEGSNIRVLYLVITSRITDQDLMNGKILSPIDQMGVKKLRGYKIDQLLSKNGHSTRRDRYG